MSHPQSTAGDAPPRSSKVTGALAALSCAACCALPLLITAGVLTGAGAAMLRQAMIATAAGLAALALGLWWLHRRRAAVERSGCGCGSCGPVKPVTETAPTPR